MGKNSKFCVVSHLGAVCGSRRRGNCTNNYISTVCSSRWLMHHIGRLYTPYLRDTNNNWERIDVHEIYTIKYHQICIVSLNFYIILWLIIYYICFVENKGYSQLRSWTSHKLNARWVRLIIKPTQKKELAMK